MKRGLIVLQPILDAYPMLISDLAQDGKMTLSGALVATKKNGKWKASSRLAMARKKEAVLLLTAFTDLCFQKKYKAGKPVKTEPTFYTEGRTIFTRQTVFREMEFQHYLSNNSYTIVIIDSMHPGGFFEVSEKTPIISSESQIVH